MSWPARWLRALSKLRFRLLGLATIKDISAETFKVLSTQLVAQGWHASSKYAGMDAGIDYDCVRLRKRFTTLKCEWDNGTQWSIEGSRLAIEAVAAENRLKVTYAWRWSEHDETSSGA